MSDEPVLCRHSCAPAAQFCPHCGAKRKVVYSGTPVGEVVEVTLGEMQTERLFDDALWLSVAGICDHHAGYHLRGGADQAEIGSAYLGNDVLYPKDPARARYRIVLSSWDYTSVTFLVQRWKPVETIAWRARTQREPQVRR